MLGHRRLVAMMGFRPPPPPVADGWRLRSHLFVPLFNVMGPRFALGDGLPFIRTYGPVFHPLPLEGPGSSYVRGAQLASLCRSWWTFRRLAPRRGSALGPRAPRAQMAAITAHASHSGLVRLMDNRCWRSMHAWARERRSNFARGRGTGVERLVRAVPYAKPMQAVALKLSPARERD